MKSYPEEGKVNQELIYLLRSYFKKKFSVEHIKIIKGGSRFKIIEIRWKTRLNSGFTNDMSISYELAPDIQRRVNELACLLFPHVRLDFVSCLRSFGSSSSGTIARCHALGKAMQLGMGLKKGFYVIEVISKRFDLLSDEEQMKVLIHELMHIPRSFGGGFRHHDYVCEQNIEREYQRYMNLKQENLQKNERWEKWL